MKRTPFLLAALCVLAASPAWSSTRTYFGFTIGVSNAPPPPVVVVEQRPHLVYVPESRVYVVDEDDDVDYDSFYASNYWYVCNDGYWYRARSHNGPYRVVDVRYVPRSVLVVPERHWRHHKRYYRDNDRYVVVREKFDHDHDRGHGRGHGKHHGHDGDDD